MKLLHLLMISVLLSANLHSPKVSSFLHQNFHRKQKLYIPEAIVDSNFPKSNWNKTNIKSAHVGHISQCVSDQDLAGHKLHPLDSLRYNGIAYIIYRYNLIYNTMAVLSCTVFLSKQFYNARRRSLSRRSIVNAQARQLLEPLETELVPAERFHGNLGNLQRYSVGKCPKIAR